MGKGAARRGRGSRNGPCQLFGIEEGEPEENVESGAEDCEPVEDQ
jgi:hypothetical protein